MTPKYTPGPWNIYFNSQDNLVIRKMFEDGAESHVIARCHSGFENSRLIAAAPDLLEALKVMVRDYGAAHAACGDLEMSPALLQAHRAIARATGEEK